MRDARILPFLLHVVLGALALYWVVFVTRCGEDECIDRSVVAGITSVFWLAGATVIGRARGAGGSQAAMRWAAAILWLFAAGAFLLILSIVAFDVVYD